MKRMQKAQKKQTAQNSLKSKERKGFGKEDVLERRGSREGVLIRGAAGIRRFAGRYVKCDTVQRTDCSASCLTRTGRRYCSYITP